MGDSIPASQEYELSDAGVFPKDWSVVTLSRVSDFITKGSTPTTFGFKWMESGVLFLRSECVAEGGLLDLAQATHISPAANEASRRSIVRDRDILITITGYVGRVVILTNIGIANINQHIARIRITAPGVFPHYVYYFLSQNKVRQELNSITTGQAYPQISLRQVREAKIVLPPEPEQRAIAEALSDMDGLLRALELLVTKKRAIMRGAMQQLLSGSTRLPGFNGTWEVKRLGDVGRLQSGSGFPIAFQGQQTGDYPFFKVSDMNNQGNELFMRVAHHWIDEETRKRLGAVAYPVGSIVFAKIGAAIFLERKRLLSQESCLDNNMMAFILEDRQACDLFFRYLFLRLELGRFVSTTALPSLSARELGAIRVRLPQPDEQRAIAEALSDMEAEIAALERRLEKTQAIKQGMMQQLLTGRVRLIKPARAEARA